MIDGSFKSVNLNKPLKRLLKALVNNAASDQERKDLAKYALSKELHKPENKRFIDNLKALSKKSQGSLFAEILLDNMITRNPRTALISTLQRDLNDRLRQYNEAGHRSDVSQVINEALGASKNKLIDLIQDQISWECNRQRLIHGVSDKKISRVLERNEITWKLVRAENSESKTSYVGLSHQLYGNLTGINHGPEI